MQQKSRNQERRFADSEGGAKQLNSGRHWFSKRDTRKFEFLVENRIILTAEQYTLKGRELPKLTRDAFFHRQLPAMNIEFDTPKLTENWMLIRTVDFDDMHQYIFELKALVERLETEKENGTEEAYREEDES
jgi:hypothetical protein